MEERRPIERILEKLEGVTRTSNGWDALCPAHRDTDASLGIAEGDDGKVLLNCRAGCTTKDVIVSLGLTMAHLFPAGEPSPLRETVYLIRDRDGSVVAEHRRTERPNGKKTGSMPWRLPGSQKWDGLRGRRTDTLPLYGVHELPREATGDVVIVTEGEKAREAAKARGYLAVGTVTGAKGTPTDDVLTALVGYDVVLWSDADDEGRDHMARVARRLVALGVAPRWLTIDGTANKHDAADYRGSDEALRALIVAAPHWRPAAEAAHDSSEQVGILLADVKPEMVDWLWQGRLARTKLTILTGDPDVGKTTLVVDLAARVSAGTPMPGETARRAPAGVVIVTAEDGLGDTIRPRLEVAGADLTRCLAARPDESPSLDADGLVWLRRACRQVDAALIVLDPLVALMPGSIDAHRDHDIRRMLRPLVALIEEVGVSCLAIRHTRKAGGAPKDAGGGSRGIGAAARVEMLAAVDPDDDEGRVLARIKGNLSAPWPSMRYRLEAPDGTVRVAWGNTSPHDARALLVAHEDDGEPGSYERAVALIEELLATGPVPSRDVDRAADAEGLSRRTMMRARQRLGVTAEKIGREWRVRLPLKSADTDPAPGAGTLGTVGRVPGSPGETDGNVKDAKTAKSASTLCEGSAGALGAVVDPYAAAPPTQCYTCRGTQYHRAGSGWACAVCHPPLRGVEVAG